MRGPALIVAVATRFSGWPHREPALRRAGGRGCSRHPIFRVAYIRYVRRGFSEDTMLQSPPDQVAAPFTPTVRPLAWSCSRHPVWMATPEPSADIEAPVAVADPFSGWPHPRTAKILAKVFVCSRHPEGWPHRAKRLKPRRVRLLQSPPEILGGHTVIVQPKT